MIFTPQEGVAIPLMNTQNRSLNFAHQQRLVIFGAKNTVNIIYQPLAKPSFDRPSGTRSNSKHQYRR